MKKVTFTTAMMFLAVLMAGGFVNTVLTKTLIRLWDKISVGGALMLIFIGSAVLVAEATAVMQLLERYHAHRTITDLVGAHPSELTPPWKWYRLAHPIALSDMRVLAYQLRNLVEKENSLFKSERALVQDVLDTSKKIEKGKKEFASRLALYKKFGIEFTTDKWQKFDNSTSVQPNKTEMEE